MSRNPLLTTRDIRGKTHRTDIWWMGYMVGGKQHCESTGTTNKRLAQKIFDIKRAEIAEGRFSGLLKSHPPTLKEYLSKYLNDRMDLHPNTRTRYAVSRRALERVFGGMRLPDITGARIEEYKADRRKGGTGPAGVNRDLSLLRQLLQQAKKERYIAHNPLGDREHFLDERKERLQAKPFTVEEEQRLLAVATGYLRPLLMLLLDTGLRPNAKSFAAEVERRGFRARDDHGRGIEDACWAEDRPNDNSAQDGVAAVEGVDGAEKFRVRVLLSTQPGETPASGP